MKKKQIRLFLVSFLFVCPRYGIRVASNLLPCQQQFIWKVEKQKAVYSLYKQF